MSVERGEASTDFPHPYSYECPGGGSLPLAAASSGWRPVRRQVCADVSCPGNAERQLGLIGLLRFTANLKPAGASPAGSSATPSHRGGCAVVHPMGVRRRLGVSPPARFAGHGVCVSTPASIAGGGMLATWQDFQVVMALTACCNPWFAEFFCLQHASRGLR